MSPYVDCAGFIDSNIPEWFPYVANTLGKTTSFKNINTTSDKFLANSYECMLANCHMIEFQINMSFSVLFPS